MADMKCFLALIIVGIIAAAFIMSSTFNSRLTGAAKTKIDELKKNGEKMEEASRRQQQRQEEQKKEPITMTVGGQKMTYHFRDGDNKATSSPRSTEVKSLQFLGCSFNHFSYLKPDSLLQNQGKAGVYSSSNRDACVFTISFTETYPQWSFNTLAKNLTLHEEK